MKELGDTSPFNRLTNPRHEKLVYFWSWCSYLLFTEYPSINENKNVAIKIGMIKEMSTRHVILISGCMPYDYEEIDNNSLIRVISFMLGQKKKCVVSGNQTFLGPTPIIFFLTFENFSSIFMIFSMHKNLFQKKKLCLPTQAEAICTTVVPIHVSILICKTVVLIKILRVLGDAKKCAQDA